jgi:hypothetical protein
MCVSWSRLVHACLKISSKSIRHASLRSVFKAHSVVGSHESECGFTKMQGFVEDYREYWVQIARRRADDSQYVGSCSLLLQGFAQLIK